MKRATIIIIALALLASQAALATPPAPKDPSADANAAAVGIGVGVALSGSESTAAAAAEGGDALALAQGGKGGAGGNGGAGGAGGQSSSDSSSDSSASSDNALNLTQNYKGVRNAPSVIGGTIYPTAGCERGFGIGGSGVNGGGLLNFSYGKKECETIVLAQNFAQIGMPETSCDLLKTTKAWQRAVKANPKLAANCEPKTPDPIAQVPINETPDLSQYVRRDELAEREKRIVTTLSSK